MEANARIEFGQGAEISPTNAHAANHPFFSTRRHLRCLTDLGIPAVSGTCTLEVHRPLPNPAEVKLRWISMAAYRSESIRPRKKIEIGERMGPNF